MPKPDISPYIKPLNEPEKILYVWTSPVGQGEDFLTVIDVDFNSANYGMVLNKVEVGSSRNEAHHMGFTDDRINIWALGLNSNRIFIFDVGQDPANPKLIRTLENISQITGLTGG